MGQNKQNIVALDYLKAFCIICVILTHVLQRGMLGVSAQNIYFCFWGYMAVPVFLIITGYVFELSVKRNLVQQFKEYFSYRFWCKKLMRFLLPYLLFLGIEIYFIYKRGGYYPNNLRDMLHFIWQGGILAPGSYYFPILFQIMILFPFLSFLINKVPIRKSLSIILAIQIIFECWAVTHMSAGIYRICFIRFLLFLALGIYLAKGHIKALSGCFLFVLGTVYIYFVIYKPHFSVPLFLGWGVIAFPTALYALGFVKLALYLNDKIKYPFELLANIGRASYHIFMVQTLYFGFRFSDKGVLTLFLVCIAWGYVWFFTEKHFLLLSRKGIGFIFQKLSVFKKVS